MKVTPNQVSQYQNLDKDVQAKKDAGAAKDAVKADKAPAQDSVTIGSQADKKATYAKPSQYVKPDVATMDALKAESNKAYSQLRDMVERLLADQGYKFQDILDGKIQSGEIKVDAATQAEAQAMIADDGPWGAEAVSDRIVDFAIAASGGDKAQFEKMKNAIIAGFDGAKKALGGSLPDVSNKTYDLVMEKLDKWRDE